MSAPDIYLIFWQICFVISHSEDENQVLHLIDFGKHGSRLKGLREYFDLSLHRQFLLGKIARFRSP